MGLSQIDLKDYDTVVAVTQASINETLAIFLNQLQKQVALYYNVDSNGNFVPATDPSTANYTFTGTLDYALDPKGNPVNMVQLYSEKGAQTVIYNITFNSAEFKSSIPPVFDVKQQPGGSPWIISFLVNLSHVSVELSSLPSATQGVIRAAVNNLGPDMFSIQQLYVDLNTAVFDTFQNVTGMNSFAGSIFTGIMQSYLASLQSSGGIIFGYSIRTSSQNAAPPTFMPTALDFCVTPYTDASGNHSNHALDTLNYLIMTGNRPLPPNPPTGFTFNWVDDPSLQGAMAIRHGLYINYLIAQLNPILQSISPVCHVSASVDKNIDDQTMQLRPGSPHTFNIVDHPVNGTIANFSYSSPPARDKDRSIFGGWQQVSMTFSSSCAVIVRGATVTLSGSAVVSADSQSSDSTGHVLDHSMPQTTFTWSVDLVLSMDPTNNGQLDYTIQNQNFSTPPTVAPDNQSAWEKFWSAVGGVFQKFAKDLGDIRETIQTQVLNSIQPALAAAIKTSNHFVFPGGTTFLFKNPQFSNTDDLASNITYLTPSGN